MIQYSEEEPLLLIQAKSMKENGKIIACTQDQSLAGRNKARGPASTYLTDLGQQ